MDGSELAAIDHIVVVYQENWSFDALYGSFPGANGIASASPASLNQRDRLTGLPLAGMSNYNNVSRTIPIQNPPVQLNGANVQDRRFLTDTNNVNSPTLVNTLLPFNLLPFLAPADLTGDIVHRYWQEQFQINDGFYPIVDYLLHPTHFTRYIKSLKKKHVLFLDQIIQPDGHFLNTWPETIRKLSITKG